MNEIIKAINKPNLYFIYRNKILFFVFTCSFLQAFTIQGQNQNVWGKPYIGNDVNLLYYPDQNANYFRYAWENKPGLHIIVKGKMPEARYFSFNIYDDYHKSSIKALSDVQILPDEADPSTYTIHITQNSSMESMRNTIIVPDSVRLLSLFLRYYLARIDPFANVPLPTIQMVVNGVNIATAASIPMPSMSTADIANLRNLVAAQPKFLTNAEKKKLASNKYTLSEKEPLISKLLTMPIFRHFSNPDTISAYNFMSDGNYPNKDNHYIVMPVLQQKKSVLLVRFKAPSHGLKLGDNTSDVRYYSLSQGNEYTNTSLTMHDEQLKISADGFVYVLVAPESEELKSTATNLGINFMPWLYKDRLVLILRHMLPSKNFKSSTAEVPVFQRAKPSKGQEAELTIGDFALKGKFIKTKEWKAVKNLDQLRF